MLEKMSVIYIPLTLLALVGDVPAQALALGAVTESLSAHQYYHTDPSTSRQQACDKCPAGTYVSKHCTQTAVRECSRCSNGTYTNNENGMEQCQKCHAPCTPPLLEKEPCTATSDRKCACSPGTFASGGTCRPFSQCAKGWGVRRPGSQSEDVRCRVCPRGTFSSTSSSVDKCQPHTNCSALGQVLSTPGTKDSDNICSPPPTAGRSTTLTPTMAPSVFADASSSVMTHKDTVELTSGVQDLELSLSSKGTLPSNTDTRTAGPISEDSGGDGVAGAVTTTAAAIQPGPTDPPRKHHKRPRDHQSQQPAPKRVAMDTLAEGKAQSVGYRPTRRGSPRPSTHKHFDINEHLPWMIVLLLLLVLVVIVVCSVKRSSRVLKKGPRQDPSSIMEKAIQKKPAAPTQVKEKWIYYSNGQGVDILKLVAAQIGSQWIDMYQYLANATEREVAAFSNGYSADHERAYAALQHWTIRDSDANLAKLINALHRQRRIDVVEKIRGVMEDNPQFDLNQLMTSVNVTQSLSPCHKPLESPGIVVEQSPVDRTKGFFADESEPLLRCDSTSSKDSALSRTGSFITKEKKDTVLRQVRLDPCDLQPIFDDMLHILNPEELHVIEEIPMAEDKLDRLFEIAGVKSQEASQTLLDSVYSHLPDLL
ncbi:hypothetical protein JZ751_005153 [Albula glossodonta]|uniref:Tumor necrosis factor receptor superfamily member 21 n=1 Tax=Albula glossodonta TaxID=121402 RepID=A0A8T2P2F1_9TELE|nr:hypothetical protein JZ751_005153 [Albula glossodonta]